MRSAKAPFSILFYAAGLFGQTSGLPYSAVELSETTQTLRDGTHVKRDGRRTVIQRDSFGRTRQETTLGLTSSAPTPQ